jgi:serine/threonine-protein phosphatase PGAM5
MAPRILYLVRHGQEDHHHQPADNLEGRLTAVGKKQAVLTAQRLRELPISLIHYSTMRRAAETAHIISLYLPHVPVRPTKLLWECTPPLTHEMRHKFFSHISDDELQRSRLQLERAYDKFFKPARGTERHEVLVCHGNIIRYFMCRAMGAPFELWHHTDIRNCAITEIVVEPESRIKGDIMLASHGDVGHLPPNLSTYL